jgi:hypothetical protein
MNRLIRSELPRLIVLLKFALEGFSLHPDWEEAFRPANQAMMVP